MERSWTASGPKKIKLGSALGRLKGTKETGFSMPGGQIPSQKEPRRVPNRGPKMVQAQNGKTLIFNEPCKDFNYLSSFADRFLVGVKEVKILHREVGAGSGPRSGQHAPHSNSLRSDQNSRRTSSGTISFGAPECILASQGRGFSSSATEFSPNLVWDY